MSETGQAMSHVHYLAEANDYRGAAFWASRVELLMPKDLTLPEHVRPRAVGSNVQMICHRCDRGEFVPTLAQAADFRDRHWYCGEYTTTRLCLTCRRDCFAWEQSCRFCDSTPAGPERHIALNLVLRQRATYNIYRTDRLLATIEAPSMRMALAAAGAMMPHEQLAIQMRRKP